MCIHCGGHLVPDKTDYVEKHENHVVVVSNVPCEKCQQCGETFFSHHTVLILEKILDSLQRISSEISLTVMDYNKVA